MIKCETDRAREGFFGTYRRYTTIHERIHSVLNMIVHKHSYFDELVGSHDVSFQHLSELRAHHYETIVTAT